MTWRQSYTARPGDANVLAQHLEKWSKEKADQVLNGCLQDGLLMILSGEDGNVIRTHFPLSISDDDLEIGMSIIEKHLLE